MTKIEHCTNPESGESAPVRFLRCLVEACCLMAVVMVPLLHDPHGWQGFQVIKGAVFRLMGLIVAGAVFLWWMEHRRNRSAAFEILGQGAGRWVGYGVWGMLLSQMVSQGFSFEPWTSFWGLPQVPGGTLTTLSGFSLCLGAALVFQREAARGRLFLAMLWTSLPLALYAILQFFRMDPLIFSQEQNVTSLAGHPGFLAGYLAMLMPLSLCMIVRSSWSRSGDSPSRPDRLNQILYSLLFCLQLSAFILAEKRGPWVALIVGIVLGLALLAAQWKKPRFVWIASGFGLAAVVVLVILGYCGSKGIIRMETPLIGRLTSIIRFGEEAESYRYMMWKNAATMMTNPLQAVFPNGVQDGDHRWRLWVGYGNQTMQDLIWRYDNWGRFMQDEMGEYRFHNLFWDMFQSGGLLFVFTGAFFLLSLAHCLKPIFGLDNGGFPRDLLTFGFGGAALGGLLLAFAKGMGFLGLGLMFGLVGGLTLGLMAPTLFDRGKQHIPKASPKSFAIMAILVSILLHVIDMVFIFPTGNTMVLFWVMSGVLWAAHMPDDGTVSKEEVQTSIPSAQKAAVPLWLWNGLQAGLLTGVMLVILGHAFLQGIPSGAAECFDFVFYSLTHRKGSGLPSALFPFLLLPTWIITTLALSRGGKDPSGFSWWIRSWAASLLFSALIGVGYLFWKGEWLIQTGPLPGLFPVASEVLFQVMHVEALIANLLWVFLGVLTGLSGVLFLGEPTGSRWSGGLVRTVQWLVVLVLVSGAGVVATWRPLQIQIAGAWGRGLEQAGRLEAARQIYSRVLEFCPQDWVIRINAAQTLTKQGLASADPGTRQKNFILAESTLLSAMNFEPRSSIYYHLGDLYLSRAYDAVEDGSREALARKGLEAYEKAMFHYPFFEAPRFGAFLLAGGILKDGAKADMHMRQADAKTSESENEIGSKRYLNLSLVEPIPALKQAYTSRAISLFEKRLARLLENSPAATDRDERFRLLLTLGTLHRNAKNFPRALEYFEQASKTPEVPELWKAEAMMAHTLVDLGRSGEAVAHLGRALEGAPPSIQAELNQFRAHLENQAKDPSSILRK